MFKKIALGLLLLCLPATMGASLGTLRDNEGGKFVLDSDNNVSVRVLISGTNVLSARKFTIGHGDLTDTDTSEDEALFTLPVGGMVVDVYAYVTTEFTGGGVGSMTVAIGTTDADLLAEEHDVFGCGDTTWILAGQDATHKGTGLYEPTDKTRINYIVGTATALIAEFTADTTTAALTAGSITIYVVYLVAQ